MNDIKRHCPTSARDGDVPLIAPRKISIAPAIGFKLSNILTPSFFIIETG